MRYSSICLLLTYKGFSKTVRDRHNHCPTELKARAASTHTHARTHRHPAVCWYTPASPRASACSAAASSQCVALADIQSELWLQLTERYLCESGEDVTERELKVEGRRRSKWGSRGARRNCFVMVTQREQRWSDIINTQSEPVCRSAGLWLTSLRSGLLDNTRL